MAKQKTAPLLFRLEHDGKFWEAELVDKGFVARWGKLGGAGTNQRDHTFSSALQAKMALDKEIATREKKGFERVTSGGAKVAAVKTAGSHARDPRLEAAIAEHPDDVGNWQVYADWLQENGEAWGAVIATACAGKKTRQQSAAAAEILAGLDNSSITWKLGVIDHLDLSPEENPKVQGQNPMRDALARAVSHPAGRFVRKLTLGLPPEFPGDINWSYDAMIPVIAKAGPFPLLEIIDMSASAEHMDQDSWRRIGDLRPLWKAAPALRELHLMGASGSDGGIPIELGTIDAPKLHTATYVSGGLDKKVPLAFGRSLLPALRYLDLYFGGEDYGNNCTLKTLAGILDGKTLPKLEHLGLMNSQWEGNFIDAVAAGKIVTRLKELALSKGTLYDEGAEHLIAHAASFKHLKRLDLTENYLTPAHCKAIKKAIPCADVGDQRELDYPDEPESRYSVVGE